MVVDENNAKLKFFFLGWSLIVLCDTILKAFKNK